MMKEIWKEKKKRSLKIRVKMKNHLKIYRLLLVKSKDKPKYCIKQNLLWLL